MKKFLLLSFLLLLGLFSGAYAQGRAVTGVVTSGEDGSPLPGANIVVKGTTNGTISGIDGKYSLNVPEDAVIVFSSIGFVKEEVALGGRSTINITLVPDITQLSEVVVVAYGTADKGTFTGSAAQIDSKQFEKRPVTNIATAVAGAAAGVSTNAGSGQPGEGPAIRIRGFGSINASNAPLYVVDGVPYSGSISNINADDVESMSILKDASSAALYGSRAANGVVMITTKKGKKDRSQITVKMEQGVSQRGIPEYDRLNAYQYLPAMWEAYRNTMVYGVNNPYTLQDAGRVASGLQAPRGSTRITGIIDQLAYNPFNVPANQVMLPDGTLNPEARLIYSDQDLDWERALSRNGQRSDYAVNYSGGSEKSDYFGSIGYLKEKGFFTQSDFERISGRINVNTKPLSWFKTGFNVAANMTNSNQANDGSSTGYVNPFFFSRNIGPIYPVYAQTPGTGEYILDEKGQKIYDLGNMTHLGLPNRAGGGSPGRHIVAETEWNRNSLKRNVVSARTFGEIYFLKDFKFTTNVGVDVTNYGGIAYQNNIVGDGAPAGRSSKTVTNTTSYTLSQLLNYNKTIGRHSIDVLAGHENYDYTYEYMYGFRQGQVAEGNIELGNFTTVNSLTSYTDRHRIESYLSRVNYGFADKYSLSASFRRDASSKFYKDSRWGNFWSVGAAWRIDKEDFLVMPTWVDMLKLRGSYGEVGNDGLLNASGGYDYYPYMALYTQGPGVNNGAEPGFLQASLPNNNLRWESNNTSDIGIDFGFLRNRITGSLEFFNRKSSNLLFNVPLPVSSGMSTIPMNVGAMFNRGIEFQIGADVVRQGDFGWNVDFNWTSFQNQITKMPFGQDELITGTKKLMVGQSMYDYWLRDWYGVDPTDGAGLYRANTWNEANSRVMPNGDTVTTDANNAKFHYAGSAIPNFMGGITNTFSYKGLTFSFLLQYQQGGKVYDATYAGLMGTNSYGAALHADQERRWRNPGDVTDVPRADAALSPHFNAASDRWLIDASYVSIRSANITYSLPKVVTSRLQVPAARIYLTGENLAMFSQRKGLNVTQSFTGVTSNAYSPARIVTLGLNVTL